MSPNVCRAGGPTKRAFRAPQVPYARQTYHRRGKQAPRDRGQATIEFVALVPWLLAAAVAAFQAYLTVVAIERADNAARAAARVESMGRDGARAAREALPGWLDSERPAAVQVYAADGDAHARVSVRVPVLYGLPYHYTITRTAVMPVG